MGQNQPAGPELLRCQDQDLMSATLQFLHGHGQRSDDAIDLRMPGIGGDGDPHAIAPGVADRGGSSGPVMALVCTPNWTVPFRLSYDVAVKRRAPRSGILSLFRFANVIRLQLAAPIALTTGGVVASTLASRSFHAPEPGPGRDRRRAHVSGCGQCPADHVGYPGSYPERVRLDRANEVDRISCLGGNDRSNTFTVDGVNYSFLTKTRDETLSDRIREHRLSLSRRHLLRGFGAGALTFLGLPVVGPALASPVFRVYPFQLGVASGEPGADGFVIWTRLAPEPFEIGYGMPAQPVEVAWEVASDDRFRTVVAKGTAIARPELGHSVHVEVAGLSPGRPYWYRFIAGRERSLAGRAVTLPVAGARLDRARFAVVGCQNYEQGYFTAHRRLAGEELDFVYCYGDYIYEGRGSRLRNTPEGPVETVRQHLGDEIYSLDDYRRRYAQYKMDADLQAAHAAAPWFSVWDDHEIDNNWADAIDQDGTPPGFFALRRQAAMQAYYENMPLRASALPVGPSMQLYRQAAYGDLIDLNLLDTRQYRSDQPCGDRWGVDCPQVARREAEMLGERQHAWLMNNVERSRAQWNVLAQQVMVMDLDRDPKEGVAYNLDSWAGYRTPRERLLRGLQSRQARNVVVLTGDEHQNYAGELHLEGRRPQARPIGVEFVATSISSGGDGQDQRPDMVPIQAANDQLKFNNNQRGYLLCDVDRERFQAEFKVLDRVSEKNGALQVRKKLVVAAGSQRLTDG